MPPRRERDLSTLERYILDEDSRREIARIRRLASELALRRAGTDIAIAMPARPPWLERSLAAVRQFLMAARKALA
jgi:hypothetical protein